MPTVDLNAAFVETAKPEQGAARSYFWDASLPGFGLMVTGRGARSYVVQYRANGISRRMTIPGGRPLTQARREAKVILGAAAKGNDPMAERRTAREARGNTVKAIAERYLADPEVAKLRSASEKSALFRRYIYPSLGARPIAEIKRSDVVRLLARVKARNGPAAANNAFKTLNRFFNWHALFDDDFRSPIVRGTFSQTKGEGARTLADDEIRILWAVSGELTGPYDHLIRWLLLTATRLNEGARMSRAEMSRDGMEWTIPASRYKGQDGKSAHAHLIPLSRLARSAIDAVPIIQVDGADSQWIFTTTGKTPIAGFSKYKSAFDERLLAALDVEGGAVRKRILDELNARYPGKGYQPFDAKWSTHSLRKTARTLMERIGIPESTAEQCLGHVRGGIVGVYNHHEHRKEKLAAFEGLAGEVERIAGDANGNILPLQRRRASQ